MVAPSVAKPNSVLTERVEFVADFTPLLPPNHIKRDAFLQAMQEAK